MGTMFFKLLGNGTGSWIVQCCYSCVGTGVSSSVGLLGKRFRAR